MEDKYIICTKENVERVQVKLFQQGYDWGGGNKNILTWNQVYDDDDDEGQFVFWAEEGRITHSTVEYLQEEQPTKGITLTAQQFLEVEIDQDGNIL